MPSDRILYRIVWLSAVALPLVAAVVALFSINSPGLAIAAMLLGCAISASALAAHLRLRIQLAGIRRGSQAVRLAQPSAGVAVPPPPADVNVIVDTLEDRLAAVEERATGRIGALLRQTRQAPVSNGLHERLSRRSVAVVASESLIEQLPADLDVQRLYPGQVAGALEASGADTLIIEEAILADGPWRGTLSPQGAPLLAELHHAMSGADGTRRQSYVVAQPGRPGLAARGLRSGALVIDDSLERPSGVSASLLDVLITYRATHG